MTDNNFNKSDNHVDALFVCPNNECGHQFSMSVIRDKKYAVKCPECGATFGVQAESIDPFGLGKLPDKTSNGASPQEQLLKRDYTFLDMDKRRKEVVDDEDGALNVVVAESVISFWAIKQYLPDMIEDIGKLVDFVNNQSKQIADLQRQIKSL